MKRKPTKLESIRRCLRRTPKARQLAREKVEQLGGSTALSRPVSAVVRGE